MIKKKVWLIGATLTIFHNELQKNYLGEKKHVILM